MPISTKRPSHGWLTPKAVASATAKTVPGIAHGSAISHSRAPARTPRRRAARRAAVRPRATAAKVATAAIHSELTTGRRCSGCATSERQLRPSSTGGKGSVVQVNGGTKETSASTACGSSRKSASAQPRIKARPRVHRFASRRRAGAMPRTPLPAATRSARRIAARPSTAKAASITVSTWARRSSPLSFEATICVVMTRKPPPKR